MLENYLKTENVNPTMIQYILNLINISKVDPDLPKHIIKELEDQRSNLKMIASENFSSISVQSAMSNLLTDKYSEGYPYHRFYAGCDNVDEIEQKACDLACELFGAEHAYVQPHSGADANLCAYWAILDHKVTKPYLARLNKDSIAQLTDVEFSNLRDLLHNQRLLGLDYYSGGHLTHGYRQNVSAQMFDAYSYSVGDDGLLDYDKIEFEAMKIRPLILLAGYSAYPGKINFKRMKEIADKAGAVLMTDMAHFAGLVAGKVFTDDYDPVKWSDVVTSTTHKTLRGPRGGIVLCKKEFEDSVDKGCPLVIGGPLPHVMLAKAVCFKEALSPDFKDYARRIVNNSSTLAERLEKEGIKVATHTTENHIVLIDLASSGLDVNGRQAEQALRDCGITCNRNALPNDPNGPWYTSGIRLGTPAITTLGMTEEDMKEIASIISNILRSIEPETIKAKDGTFKKSKVKYKGNHMVLEGCKERVKELLNKYVLYPEIDLDFLKKEFIED